MVGIGYNQITLPTSTLFPSRKNTPVKIVHWPILKCYLFTIITVRSLLNYAHPHSVRKRVFKKFFNRILEDQNESILNKKSSDFLGSFYHRTKNGLPIQSSYICTHLSYLSQKLLFKTGESFAKHFEAHPCIFFDKLSFLFLFTKTVHILVTI